MSAAVCKTSSDLPSTGMISPNEIIKVLNKVSDAKIAYDSAYPRHNKEAFLPSLPQIAVVGNQSAGKSALLQAIVGFDFLPSNDGSRVTNRPIQIRLSSEPDIDGTAGNSLFDVAFVNDGSNRQKCHNPTELLDAITKANGTNISEQPIIVQIHSDKYKNTNLTFVDLPGLVPASIDDGGGIKKIVKDSIDSKNTIVLHVHEARTADLAHDSALNDIIRPGGHQKNTIGVLTKLDHLTDEQQGQKLNNLHDVKRWVPVMNHSERRDQEDEFFTSRKSIYQQRFGNDVGIKFLTNCLQQELLSEIKKSNVLSSLIEAKDQLEIELDQLDELVDPKNRQKYLLNWAEKGIRPRFKNFEEQISGTDIGPDNDQHAGAAVVSILAGDFLTQIDRVCSPEERLKKYDPNYLSTLFDNSGGANDRLNFYGAVEKLVRDAILPTHDSPVQNICIKCLNDVKKCMFDHIQEIMIFGNDETSVPPKALDWVLGKTDDVLEEWKKECQDFIKTLVSMEAHINRRHLYLEDQKFAYETIKPEKNSNAQETTVNTSSPVSASSEIGVNKFVMKPTIKLMENILCIAKSNIQDSVTKAIRVHFFDRIIGGQLETEVMTKWNNDLVTNSGNEDGSSEEIGEVQKIMGLTEELIERRKRIEEAHGALQDAVTFLKEARY
jgi:GTP-binding protein EngB required for normal cell division